MNGMFNGMFGRIAPGMCRLSMDGGVAIKTSSGYKTYDEVAGRLTNCSEFVFNVGEEFFFVIPTNHVKAGDIILANGRPKCVIESGKERITAINYEDSTVEQILPEHYIFMGNTYFYGKIVSMFGSELKKGNNTDRIMKYMMLSEMMKGNSKGGGMSELLPLLLLGNKGDGLFDGIFGLDEDGEDSVDESKRED